MAPSWFPMLPRDIVDQVDYLLQNSVLPIQVDGFRKSHESHSFFDRFSVLIPCFLEPVRWEVIFSCQHPYWPPDVIFAAHDSDFQPLATNSSISSILKGWDSKDPSTLLRFLVELRNEYLQYQRKRVEELKDSRLHFEVNTLESIEDLEMGLVTDGDNARVIFSIPLHEVDLSKLARQSRLLLQPPNTGVVLQVCYPVQREFTFLSAVPLIKLHAPNVLREVFKVEDVRLPAWTDSMCLAEYIPKLLELLQSQIVDACASLTLRRNFIEALVPVFGRPLEAETDFGRKVSMIASAGVFTFLIHISLPLQFPKVQPTLLLQSSQHFDSQGRPISRAYEDYPWSPRWDPSEMVSRICDFITEENASFKQYCNESLQYH
ncbi:hypothetical protein SELMODRAFT_445185 [Selaginella moellendorffii]|uniref:BRISC and BRCA1-A complex member 2 n=1 Tax=Selaginella moellendorffii TaxID=88036 RepID=D8SGI7_SELML|nr:BRISC and BRCA1-A complex member 2 [Selaginella moellendorffii]XP_024543430.1 BRISC and BRCA1-A complex member 2 [Selaginella moellendorffii]EFJ16360.1 hypothetical protein SELMODRAFT_445185 [Selaginella moellendorffii]|eukprot:XP_002982607.1 BRISC and BRCA1-A complex member 2 [Selaginella moellendorffii]